MVTCKKCGGTIHGDECKLCEMFQCAAGPDGHRPSCWPMLSSGMGVHPKDIKKAMASARQHGVAVEYNSDGRAIIRSRQDRKNLMKISGIHDRNGGYGD